VPQGWDRKQDDLDSELKENNMSNQQKTASAQTRIAAAVMFMLLVGTGYAITPSVESAADPMTVAALTPSFEAAGQWTGDENLNPQAGDEEVAPRFVAAEEHIQAF
jgi:hypothetical protein